MQERKTNALITVTTHQTGEELDDIITFTYPASAFEKGDCLYLFYEEFDPDTKEATRTSLRIRKGHVAMSRKGMMNSEMDFIPGAVTETEYRNPFGLYPLSIDTKQADLIKMGEDRELRLVYDLAFTGTLPYRYEMTVKIHPMKKE